MRPAVGEIAARDDLGEDAARGGDRQAGRLPLVRNHADDPAGNVGSDAASISAAMFEPRPEIRIAVFFMAVFALTVRSNPDR